VQLVEAATHIALTARDVEALCGYAQPCACEPRELARAASSERRLPLLWNNTAERVPSFYPPGPLAQHACCAPKLDWNTVATCSGWDSATSKNAILGKYAAFFAEPL
jgi:hypothetical protein